MRAMVLEKPRPAEEAPLQLRDIPEPTSRPGEIRVRVRVCGVCHTDLHIVQGELPMHKLPVVPGHQVVGVVDAVGTGAKGFKEGDRAGVIWLHSTDGSCEYCRRNSENLCVNAKFTGYDVNGGYAESVIVPAAFAYTIPKTFSDENAAPLLCAGVIGYRSLKLSGAARSDGLGLYGFGASAHIVLQIARHMGCEVYVFTRAAAHRELAKKLGAAWVGDAKDRPPHELDAAIVFAPAGPVVLDALRALRKGGTVALAGITMTPIPQMDYSLMYGERIVRSVANSTRQDARELLELAAEVPVRTAVTPYALEEANRAVADMKHSRIGGAAVLRVSE
ncbi:MAG TPA: zinc-dependent alcohol dehydrogenase family protein [Terriglobales bacterium]|nr:zinc-dependent alcohol dehydrogenase family protein [Terriglobales bacterium]